MVKHDRFGAPLVIVVGSGGVGKTTLAAALALRSARRGDDTLVMTFDPSRRLKDALGVGEAAAIEPVRVKVDTPARLDASLLDAGATFDRLVARYAPDETAARRILENRFYRHLAGGLAGILEYMAVERLFEVAGTGRYTRIILDTPPTRQALDFLEAPDRMVRFLDSGALQVALQPWFDARGRLRAGKVRLVGRGIEALLDRLIGLGLLRDIAEFFQAFGPLYAGFRERALEVRALLQAPGTRFVLVAGPGSERVADTLFFARKLAEAGCRLETVIVNQLHPVLPKAYTTLAAVARRDQASAEQLRMLLSSRNLLAIPLLAEPPSGVAALEALGTRFDTPAP